MIRRKQKLIISIYGVLIGGVVTCLPSITLAQIPPASSPWCLYIPSFCDVKFTPPTGTVGTPDKPKGKITINADAWIGNKDVTAGDTLKIGKNTLVITQETAKTGNPFGISNYQIPTNGKAVWDGLQSLMGERVVRGWVSEKNTQIASHCTSATGEEAPVRELFFDGKHDPFSGAALPSFNAYSSNRPVAFWMKAASAASNPTGSIPGAVVRASKPCPLVLAPNVRIHGTGTIINIDNSNELQPIAVGKTTPTLFVGGRLVIQGKMIFDNPARDTLGYISFANPRDPDSGKVTLGEGAEVKNMAIFTTGTIEMKGNPNTSNVIQHKTELIGRILSFPLETGGDIIFDRSEALAANPPPLFENVTTPGAKEGP